MEGRHAHSRTPPPDLERTGVLVRVHGGATIDTDTVAGRTGVEVLVSGGRVRGGDLACSNHQALEFFSNIRADVAFLGSGGLDADAGLTDFHIDECATRKTILAGTAKSYVLADASKFGRVAPHRVCGFDRVEAVITDQCPPDRLRDAIESAGASALF